MNDEELVLRRKRQNAERARAYRKRLKDLELKMEKHVCRVCLLEKTAFNEVDAFTYGAKLENYNIMLQQTFNIQSLKSRENVICDQCADQIRDASKLKHLILKSDQYLANNNNNLHQGTFKNVESNHVMLSSGNGIQNFPSSSSETIEKKNESDAKSSRKYVLLLLGNHNKNVPSSSSSETPQIRTEPDAESNPVMPSGYGSKNVPSSSSETIEIKIEPDAESNTVMMSSGYDNKNIPSSSSETIQIKIEPDAESNPVMSSSGYDNKNVPLSSSSETIQIKIEPDETSGNDSYLSHHWSSGNYNNDVPSTSETIKVKSEPETEVKCENAMDGLLEIEEEMTYAPSIVNPPMGSLLPMGKEVSCNPIVNLPMGSHLNMGNVVNCNPIMNLPMGSLLNIGKEVNYNPIINPPLKVNSEESTATQPGTGLVTKYFIINTVRNEVNPNENLVENADTVETDSANTCEVPVSKDVNSVDETSSDYRGYFRLREGMPMPCLISGRQMKKAAKDYRRKYGKRVNNDYEFVLEPKRKTNKKRKN